MSENKTFLPKNNRKIIYGVIALLVILAIAIGGYFYWKNQQNNTTNNSSNSTQNANTNNNARRGNFANLVITKGKVSSISGKTVVIDSSDGTGQKIVQLSDTSTVLKLDSKDKASVLTPEQNILLIGSTSGSTFIVDSAIIPTNLNPNGQNNNSGNGGTNPNPNRTRNGGTAGNAGSSFGGAGANDGTMLRGKVVSSTDTEIVIQTSGQNGKQVTANYSSSTQFGTQATGVISDLKEGQLVQIVGQNSGATITATNIAIYKN